ncbi:hypothetical protein [Arthrobacter globiformis]|nr:hypothetical protein [Arthrobacter globiformis]
MADRFDLLKNIQLNTRVTGAKFDEAQARWIVTTQARWIVTTDAGEVYSA